MSELAVEPKTCGMGTKHCCAYLALGGEGFFCGRESLRHIIDVRIAAGESNATRSPQGPYPDCQSEGIDE